MNRPSLFTYLIGNALSCLVILVACAGLGFQWWQHRDTAPWFVPVVAIWLASATLNANGKLVRYRAWQREWKAVEAGEAPARASVGRSRGMLKLVIWLGLSGWLVAYAPEADRQPLYGPAVLVFLLINLALLIGLMQRLWRRWRVQATRPADHVVTLCLQIPKESPKPLHALAAVPVYCQQLLHRRQINS